MEDEQIERHEERSCLAYACLACFMRLCLAIERKCQVYCRPDDVGKLDKKALRHRTRLRDAAYLMFVPDHKTIADFRKDNGRAIRQVCTRFVALWTRTGHCVAL